MMKRWAKVLLCQSEFQDWITAVEMNEHIALMDARASELAERLRSGEIKSGSLKRTADGLLKVLFTQPTRTGTRQVAKIGKESLVEARRRIEHQNKEEIAGLGVGSWRAVA